MTSACAPRTVVLLLGGVAAACASGRSTVSSPTPEAAVTATSSAEIEALYRARQDSARMRFTEADVRFVTGMIGHHAQALIMSGLARTHGASPALRRLAARIINAQEDEIALMSQWLEERGQPVPQVHIEGTRLLVHGAEHTGHMPGMLTPEQLQSIDAARGTEFDRLFLTLMIQHHRGAVTMVHELFATDGASQGDQVFKLGSDIAADQTTEVARMEHMLAEMSGGRAPR